MASNTFSFSTGETWSRLYADLQKQVNQLNADVRTLMQEREVARATNDALIRAGAAAETGKAEAERKLVVSGRLFKSLHEHHRACPGSMDATSDQAWEYGLEIQAENARFKEEVKQLKDDRLRLETDLAFKAKESETKEKEAAALKRRTDELTQARDELRDKLDQETKDAADIRTNLDTAYADLTRKGEEHRALRKQKDDIEAELFGTKLQLQDAHDHYQQSQQRVAELESQKSAIEALERDNATLQADHDHMQEKLNEQDRAVLVKDVRIGYLETQVQKALTAAARAQDAQNKADAAVDPTTAEPTSVVTTGESLEDELNNSGELYDPEAASQLELSLELVAAVTAAHTAPVDAPTTTSSTQTAVSPTQVVTSSTLTQVSTTADTSPVEPSAMLSESDVHALWETRIEPALRILSTSSPRTIDLRFIVETVQDLTGSSLTTTSTQTEEEEKNEELSISLETVADIAPVELSLESSVTQTESPKLTHTGISTVFDQPPVVYEERHTQTNTPTAVYEERHTQTDAPQLKQTGTSTVLDHPPVVHEERHTQTDAPQLTQTGTSTVLDHPPVVHEERHTQTDAPQLTQTGTSTVLDEPPIVQEDRHTQTDIQAPPTVVYVPKKRSIFSLSTALAIFFALLAILYYAELESWKNSSNRAGVNRLYNSMGYQRRGRHLFGTIPVCYQRGETWLTEAFCQQFAAGVQKIEASIGIKYPSTWW
ncbi:hypothetical protein P171DRAFT_449134 [Karstenula rhodostoma CBS 690.94]|uniref:Uncharacterized protein n=1 Tax=Karstenula rhodostoma CBS 690.94 TaxID=1392251 RepID=A0A9P4U4Z9_9PLEO|nr:hypothetical protein P171DRAFT_449134 [Karstenula rhodostoma CBS 690.94]